MNPFALFSLIATFLMVYFDASQLDAWQEKVDPVLLEKAQAGPVDAVILLKEQANLTDLKRLKTKTEKGQAAFTQLRDHATKTQQALRQLLMQENCRFQPFFLVNAIRAELTLDQLQLFAERPEVAQIVENSVVNVPEVKNTGQSLLERGPDAIEWGIQMINADLVWELGYRGQGVIVGGQDTGYEWDHPALKDQYLGWDGSIANHNYHWHDAIHEINPLHNDSIPSPSNNPCGLDVPYPCDDHNHGTHTMGTMIGEDGENLIGVAPGARWIACRNMERGYGSPATYIECFEWFLAPTDLNDENPDPSKAPHVIANSWSCPELEGCNPSNFALMQTAVDNLKAAGVVVVVSAGNSGSQGCGSVSTPAAIFENSFTVGASNESDSITGFSSRGPVLVDGSERLKPNVVAPGRNVRSSIRGGQYATYNGTSMAGPHVAGAVALILSANPDLAGNVEVIETILEQTAVPKQTEQDCGDISGLEVPNNTYGFGRIDALVAVEEALKFNSTSGPGNVQTALQAYPNPFQKVLVLEFSGLEGPVNLQLFDAAGREVYREEWTAQGERIKFLELSNLASGVYWYQLQQGQEKLKGKVVKIGP